MIQIIDKRNCVGCANCVQICPTGCIVFKPDNEGFMYPHVDGYSCIKCMKCNQVCPVDNDHIYHDDSFATIAFGAVNNNSCVRMASSSGGIFSALASEVLNMNGVVYGASDLGRGKVEHIPVHKLEDLPLIQRSKYVQSDLVGVIPRIDDELKKETLVLFSGTPCQVKALYMYLRRRPSNLISVEVVCHGVPSPLVYEKYLNELGADRMIFRNKERSWSDYDVEIISKEGSSIIEKASKNLFMRGFLQNWFLRPSCSKCPAKSFTSGADITLGDFWGGQLLAPELFDDKGVSIVCVHSFNGEELWCKIRNAITSRLVRLEKAKLWNPCISYSVDFPKNRSSFFKDLGNKSVVDVLSYYVNMKPSLTVRVKSFLSAPFILIWSFLLSKVNCIVRKKKS